MKTLIPSSLLCRLPLLGRLAFWRGVGIQLTSLLSLVFMPWNSSFAQVSPASLSESSIRCQNVFKQNSFLGSQVWVYNDFQENPVSQSSGKSPRQIFAQEKMIQQLATKETLESMTFGEGMAFSYARGDLLIGFPEVLKSQKSSKKIQEKKQRQILIGNPYLGTKNFIALPNIHWKKGSFHEVFRNLDGAVKVEIYENKIYLHRISYADKTWNLAQESTIPFDELSPLGLQPKFFLSNSEEPKKVAASNEQMAVILLETTKPSGGLSFLFINLQNLEVSIAQPFGLPSIYPDIQSLLLPETGLSHFAALLKTMDYKGREMPHYLKFERGIQLHRTQRFFRQSIE